MTTSMGKKRILFIEDEPYYHEIFGKPLEKAGFKVDYALNGEKGAEQMRNHQYDALIVDLIMPMMSGKRFLQRIKKGHRRCIVLTNLEGDSDREDMERLGIGAFLIKSRTTPEEMIKTVQHVIKPRTSK